MSNAIRLFALHFMVFIKEQDPYLKSLLIV